MGYFANGVAGQIYQHQWCDRCIHDIKLDCSVWLLHLLDNYDAVKDVEKGKVLEMFIPQKGIENLQCTMFVAKEK